MRIAWFRAVFPDAAVLLDETAPVIARLRAAHHLDLITEAEAHDFVWRHFRAPYDVCVYELGSTPAHRFMRAYLPHYPGVVAPHGLGVARPQLQTNTASSAREPGLRLGVLDPAERAVADRAAARAREAGVLVHLTTGDPAIVLSDADLLVATEWPASRGIPTAALLGMAAQRAVAVLEVEATAGWPALDPQTWQPRGWSADAPVVVSIDPRDEEHSLLLTIKRLAADAGLRQTLAAAGHAWWDAHATLDHAVQAWEQILTDAAGHNARTTDAADHSDGVRATLAEFGATVDFLS